jgi:hypothetical protein
MKDQYYPALIDSEYIVNGVDMDKNMIITGPNAGREKPPILKLLH